MSPNPSPSALDGQSSYALALFLLVVFGGFLTSCGDKPVPQVFTDIDAAESTDSNDGDTLLEECSAPSRLCGTTCADLTASREHCGACDNDCSAHAHSAAIGSRCSDGACEYLCEIGWADCTPTLLGCETNVHTDPMHCGACGIECGPGEVCTGGSCVCGERSQAQGAGAICGATENCCQLQCVPEADPLCTCGLTPCPNGETCCGGDCAALANDANHCGDCATQCRADQVCDVSVCACPSDTKECAGTCLPLGTCCYDEDCGTSELCVEGTCTDCDAACDVPCTGGVCLPPPALYFTMDEASGDLVDGLSGTTCMASGAMDYAVTGQLNEAIHLHGGERFDCGDLATAHNLSGFTIALWFLADEVPSTNSWEQAMLVTKTADDIWDGGFALRVSGRAINGVFQSPSGRYEVYSNADLTADVWYHTALVYDGRELRVFVNGLLENTHLATGIVDGGNAPFLIGDSARPDAAPYGFKGLIDDVRFYDQPLSDSAVALLAR